MMKNTLKRMIVLVLVLSVALMPQNVQAKTGVKYNIKFDGNGATSGKMSSLKNRVYGKTYTLSKNTYKKTGYVFTGWNTKKNGYGITYKNKSKVKNLTKKNGKTVTLYAQWKRSLKVFYSNLNDKLTLTQVKKCLTDAGVSASRQNVLFNHIKQFNGAVDNTKLKGDINTKADILIPTYDPYDYMEQWDKKYPGFEGYNCRITAFGLIGDFVNIDANAPITDGDEVIDIFLDKDSLKQDPSGLCGDTLEDYLRLYSAVPTKNTTNKNAHAKVVENDWKSRGISFDKYSKVNLITVWFHNKTMDNKDLLAVGHVGVAVEAEDGYIFIEKVAFKEPYNAIKFSSIKKINEYLMAKYDNSWGQDTAGPFIMVNDQAVINF